MQLSICVIDCSILICIALCLHCGMVYASAYVYMRARMCISVIVCVWGVIVCITY